MENVQTFLKMNTGLEILSSFVSHPDYPKVVYSSFLVAFTFFVFAIYRNVSDVWDKIYGLEDQIDARFESVHRRCTELDNICDQLETSVYALEAKAKFEDSRTVEPPTEQTEDITESIKTHLLQYRSWLMNKNVTHPIGESREKIEWILETCWPGILTEEQTKRKRPDSSPKKTVAPKKKRVIPAGTESDDSEDTGEKK